MLNKNGFVRWENRIFLGKPSSKTIKLQIDDHIRLFSKTCATRGNSLLSRKAEQSTLRGNSRETGYFLDRGKDSFPPWTSALSNHQKCWSSVADVAFHACSTYIQTIKCVKLEWSCKLNNSIAEKFAFFLLASYWIPWIHSYIYSLFFKKNNSPTPPKKKLINSHVYKNVLLAHC